MTSAEAISDVEAFENAYGTFIFCLGALAGSPEEACEKYGNYNVAWEIQDDVASGVYLAKNLAHRLSLDQVAAIQALANALKSLPKDAIGFTKVIEESLENMRHPAWEKVRRMAAELQNGLRTVTAENVRYFSGESNVL